MSKKIHGIGASEGVALAKALVLIEEEIKISKEKSSNPTDEITKLEHAIQASVADLEKLRTTTLAKLGEEKAAIFDAHKEIASDPAMKEEMVGLIKNDHVKAEFAADQITNNYFEMFSSMDDEYFRERSADIKDVAHRIIKHILGIKIVDLSTIKEEVIIVAEDLTPSQTAQLNKQYVKGFATNIGGRTSHAAIMARSLEIPAVLGLKTITQQIHTGDMLAINGATGVLELDLTDKDITMIKAAASDFAAEKAALLQFKNKTSKTADGVKKIIEANIGSPTDVEAVLENGSEGVGLFRSEFLYMDNDHFPTEDEQYEAYKKVVSAMPEHLVVIRTLDIGGDKKLSYFAFPHELNPFLGYRAIRFTLGHADIFKTQLKALLRASAHGKLGIMFPMIATVDEFVRAKKVVEACKQELTKAKIAFDQNVQVGMMVEIPAAAVNADQFSKYADFFSIGTNDLIQYSMAADRMSENVAYLYQPLNPAILKLIKLTIDGAHKHNKWVGMCGEMAGDVQALPVLLGLGLDAFSMSATSILRARALMSKITTHEAQQLATKVLECDDTPEVIGIVEQFLGAKK